MAAPDYRRRKGDDTGPWHFCSNCKDWPKEHYEAQGPQRHNVCSQCLTLERRQMCTRTEAYL